MVINTARSAEVQGAFLFVERGRSRDLAITTRTRDMSRQGQTWGTVIPAVRESELFGQRFSIVDVPLESQFRSSLRLYDVRGESTPDVRVRIYAIDPLRDYPRESHPDTLLLELFPTFRFATTGGRTAEHPAYAEIHLSAQPELAFARRVRVEVQPLDGRDDYWGFVSVTHNETQHVTVMPPR